MFKAEEEMEAAIDEARDRERNRRETAHDCFFFHWRRS